MLFSWGNGGGGMYPAEIDAMPNGGVTLSVYTENDIETCRDVLFYVAQVLGGFFSILSFFYEIG